MRSARWSTVTRRSPRRVVPLRSSQTGKNTSATPRLLRSVRTASQNFAPSPTGPGPQAEDVVLPGQTDPDRGVDRPVRDLTITHLDHDRVEKDHRIDAVEGPV